MSARFSVPTGVTQERTARPRAMTVHAPHCPRPQPNFGPRSPRSSLSTYRRGVAGSTSTVSDRPLTWRAMELILDLRKATRVAFLRGSYPPSPYNVRTYG